MAQNLSRISLLLLYSCKLIFQLTYETAEINNFVPGIFTVLSKGNNT